jgi:DNA invertase Pin-like site-specific DNA recombinase
MGSADRRKAFSYVRISSGTQARGGGIRRQLQESREYAEHHGFELVEHLEDIGVSAFQGKNQAPTAALGRFLEAMRTGKVPSGSRLLIESLDRLSRREALKAVGIFIEILTAGVEITTLMDGRTYTAATTFEELMFCVTIMMRAHEESMTKSKRLKAAWRQKKERAGTKPMTAWCPSWLRLSRDRSRYEVVEDRARVIRHIFSEAAAGVGSYSIVRRLNEHREPHFGRSRVWNLSFVSKVLTNLAVMGHFQPHKVVDGRRVPDGPIIEDYFPKIVDAETFRRVQNGLRERLQRGRGRKGHNVANLFPRDMMTCAYCRSSMRYESKGRGKGSFICYAALRGVNCVRARWSASDLEASILAFCREVELEGIIHGEDETRRTSVLESEIETLKDELTMVGEKMEKTYDLMDTGAATAFISGKLRELEERQTIIETELREKEAERAQMSATGSAREGSEHLRSMIEKLQGTDDAGEDVFRLRSAISSRLRSIVTMILVAPEGHAPFIRKAIADEPNVPASVVDHEAYDRRYFGVGFRDGTVRVVIPDRDDPLRFDVQVVGTKGGTAGTVIDPDQEDPLRFDLS